MESLPKPSPEVDAAVKQVTAAKSFTAKDELVRHFGEDRLTDDGQTYQVRLDSWREVQEFDEMDRPRARLETEAAQAVFARVPMTLLRASNGRTWEVPDSIVDGLLATPLARALGVKQVPRLKKKTGLWMVNGNRVSRIS